MVKGWCIVFEINYTPCKKLTFSYMRFPVMGLQKK